MSSANEIQDKLQNRLNPDARVDGGPSSVMGRTYLKHVSKIECADGLILSVQASEFHYCTPRNSKGPWSTVEVGFPTRRVAALMPYIDSGIDDDPTQTVYGYVPLNVVAQVIYDAGGFAPSAPDQLAEPTQ